MGLDRDFLSMLTASAQWRKKTGRDQWGNDQYGVAATFPCYIGATSQEHGTGEQGGKEDPKPVLTREITCDALGIAVDDLIVVDGIDHAVAQVQTEKDEFGDDLYQIVTVRNEKGISP